MPIAGLDEVGRGALAGPVVVGIVVAQTDWGILDPNLPVHINDSKKLTQKQRNEASIWIHMNCLKCGIGVSSASEIDEFGIVHATNLAACRAWLNLGEIAVSKIKTDAFYFPELGKLTPSPQEAIIKGDSISGLIAAASIIAKVYRDTEMICASEKHPNYFWHKNKGYGTKDHIDAIIRHGKTTDHRSLFVRKFCE